MKITVVNEKREKELFLSLKQDAEGKVRLCAVHADGSDIDCGNILFINADGMVLVPGVNEDVPLPKDNNGAIRVLWRK